MIEVNKQTEYEDLLFTHEETEEDVTNIYVEDPANGNMASLACAVYAGVFSNNDDALTDKQHKTCVDVMNWASAEGIY